MTNIISCKKDVDYKIDIFTIKESSDFYINFIKKNDYYEYEDGYERYNLKKKIHYFDYNDIQSSYGSSDVYNKTCRLIIAHNEKEILGICKFAYWGSSESYAISYLSTNNEFFGIGISKKLLEKMFEYFSNTYPNDILSFSGYSVEGWKYLRKNILSFSNKYKVKITEKSIQYPGISGIFSDEDRELMYKSMDEIKNLYGIKDYCDY